MLLLLEKRENNEMALDGTVVSNIVYELNNTILNGRINKISQPEDDELIITIKSNKELFRLLISSNPSLPLIYLTDENKPSPMTAPNFCMLLRKHLNSAKIISISQPSLERVIDFEIEHYNELGDLCTKHLIVELMGKHSNIIFTDDKHIIIDSIKHVSAMVSSVREVLPGRDYFIPFTSDKHNPVTTDEDCFVDMITHSNISLQKSLYSLFTGISPYTAAQIAEHANISCDEHPDNLSPDIIKHLYKCFKRYMDNLTDNKYVPCIIYKNDVPVEYSSFIPVGYDNDVYTVTEYDSIFKVLSLYYAKKNEYSRIHGKSADLRKILKNSIERTSKKLDLQTKQLKDTQKREKYKVYGDLIMAYSYDIVSGSKSYTCLNFYDDNKEITIPLDADLSPTDNGKVYYNKYTKLKRTYEALTSQVEDSKNELEHLESISNSLLIATTETDLNNVKKELMDYGYIKYKKSLTDNRKRKQEKNGTKPYHYVSSDGYDIYVGRNNYQNDELTFKFANGNDWWFHSKTIAGSHVILKCGNDTPSDKTFEEAAAVAGYYSKGRDYDKVEIDYIQKKNVKKPNSAKPGFVIYHTNYSMVVKPSIDGLKKIID